MKVEISPSSSTDQHTVSTSSATAPSLLSSWTSILPAKNKDEPLVLDSSDEEADDSHLPFKDRKLPTFISLSVNKDDGDDVIGDDNETKKGTVKPVLSRHSKIDKTKVLKTNGSLMKVESVAECSLRAFCNTFDLHLISDNRSETNFWYSFEWPLKMGFTGGFTVNDGK